MISSTSILRLRTWRPIPEDPRIKKRVIEILDRAFAYALNEIVTEPAPNILLVITADHSTNSAGRMIHSGESVPLTMIGAYTRRDTVTRFDEISNASGSLSLVRGPGTHAPHP